MKLRSQILLIGLAGGATAELVGAVGLYSTSRLADAFDGSVRMGLAAQNSQGAAMMLGAIRGDVQRAMLGSIGRDKKQVSDAQKALDEHSKALASALDSLVQSPLSAQTKATINDTVPVARAYTKAAAQLLNLAATDTAAAAAVPEFQRLFNELEKQMAAQVEAIRKDGSAFSESSALVVEQARYAVGAALLLATGLVVLAAFWLSARLSRPMAHAVKVARSLAQGDLSLPVSVGGNDETAQLLQAMADMQSSLAHIVFSVKTNAGRVAVASAEIAHGNTDLSARTERQASSLEETAAAMEQLSAAVDKNAQSALQANRLATHASVTAMKAGEVVEKVAETMHVIQESSKKISAIVSLVDGIAAQTNILALNAGVEAARAAEFGKGFAVVASEVRSLAGRAADAAKEISALIRASSERIESGGELVGQTVAAMREVVTSSRRATEIMGEISAASSEQSAGVAEVGKAVADMDEVTQRNSALVEQMAAATKDLNTQANQLVQVVAVFKLPSADAAPCPVAPPSIRAHSASPAGGEMRHP